VLRRLFEPGLCTNLPAIPLQPAWDDLEEDERCPVCSVLVGGGSE